MTRLTLTGTPFHPALGGWAEECRTGRMSRREFLTRAAAFGATAAGAAGLIGAAAPARAAPHVAKGGTLRIQQEVHPLTEPRLFQWSEMGNIARGWLEYLVQYERDGTFTPSLLESWEVDNDATGYVLNLRPGVTWNTGAPLTAEHVAWNFEQWCDATVEGNSMATRMGPLVDPTTRRAREGAITVRDPLTVVLSLPRPDITLIAGISDYPAAVVHPDSVGRTPIDSPIGTGPYLPESYAPGDRAVIVKNPNHAWWNAANGGWLDRIEFIDFGTDPASHLRALVDNEVDMLYESVGRFIDALDTTEFTRSAATTAATVVTRTNQTAEIDGAQPYADVRVRRALQMAVDNGIVLELGHGNRGLIAENHHVCPIHPEYAALPVRKSDPKAALDLMTEAGMADYVHELISLDDGFERDTTDAVAAQLRDAGFKVNRRVLPQSVYYDHWSTYPFSSTSWNHRPLGIQILSLAYRSGVPWNETGFANAEFDTVLEAASAIADADERRALSERLQQIMQEEGVVIQPYWRSLVRHYKPSLVGAEMHPQFEIRYQHMGFGA